MQVTLSAKKRQSEAFVLLVPNPVLSLFWNGVPVKVQRNGFAIVRVEKDAIHKSPPWPQIVKETTEGVIVIDPRRIDQDHFAKTPRFCQGRHVAFIGVRSCVQ